MPQGIPDAEDIETRTLEAFADTILPGAKRTPDDVMIAGRSHDAGAVEAGALELLRTPATGVTSGLGEFVGLLNDHAEHHAGLRGLELTGEAPPFVQLPFEERTALVTALTSPGHPEKEFWVMLALFCNMAYDSAAHTSTPAAIAAGHPGLRAMGFAAPDADGLLRFKEYSYGRPLARLHSDTTSSGSPA
ncbi:DUF5987 family protein [Nocardiopsis exhalans]|uniref:Uncharacterized protein n=2 Tax=Nocardiopsis TaxID=2013 RepID=A0A840WHK0_9ACTN|nr:MULTISPECIES: DUF5987 family protein [Nocardiopsis]MBB5490936.1 hypothetical protein [Nocardiopsis metallicus]USY17557.1 DUF5987 family protein [Nocardiopsis exhalans]